MGHVEEIGTSQTATDTKSTYRSFVWQWDYYKIGMENKYIYADCLFPASSLFLISISYCCLQQSRWEILLGYISFMAAILASQGCCCRIGETAYHGKLGDDLSFSGSISNNCVKFRNNEYHLFKTQKVNQFQVRVQQTELSAKVGTNGRPTKMVPTTELKNRIPPSKTKPDTLNESLKKVNGVPHANESSLIKRDVPAQSSSKKASRSKQLPPVEELTVLPSDEGFSWANENYNSIQRSIDVWSFVISLRVRVLFDNAKWAYIGGFSEDKQGKRRRKTASWLRESVLQLGPTFIKLGQLSSTRSDLFPNEFVEELAKLQDRVPAFSPEKAKRFIEKELGATINMLFKEFEDRPIAAASLGQVHRAILHNGERVVIKVQRPGLKRLFDIDLKNLKLIAEYFQRSETLGGPTRDWVGIYEECAKVLYEEIDYVNEGKNADRFRRDFRNIKWVRVPMVHWDYTTTRVLTLEYAPGIKINQVDAIDQRGYNRATIASHAIEAYLIQILKTGFFHADPHPGNLAIDDDEALIYYDFGMMGDIKSFTRERLLELFYAVYEKDAKKVMQSLIDLGALQPTGDMTSVRRSVQFFLDNLLDQRPDQQQTLSAIGEDLFAIATDQPFRFPATFTFVLRAFSTLEGIGYTLNPDFSFPKIAAPYAQELLDLRQRQRTGTQLVQEIRKQADDARSSAISMPSRIQQIEEIVKQLESGDLKLRVRVLESERAARKATILQMATIYTVSGGTLLNLGVTFSSQGNEAVANGSLIAAGVFFALILRSMQRVKKLDKFEKMI
ncbi:protein ACTIVITY OF BC1 COMPLEX KINASE 7, chloroplastic isoform X2 [Andrographis paniculata]|uniref:protein ACTIVITY OF BC1 COMPLEX KINASE 7, chloroplastic isoform X2 n=1 Tax=Andrographis paniculata TaxID=175694 RepID=UPI0021E75EF9|nr:protein ACTIVITY OF BC1 COMPLEX KINASE 7, chloroplastic isoform X2 [Andrographis paniculata]